MSWVLAPVRILSAPRHRAEQAKAAATLGDIMKTEFSLLRGRQHWRVASDSSLCLVVGQLMGTGGAKT